MWHSRLTRLRLPVLRLPRAVCSADSADVSSHLHASSAQYLADLGPLWEFVKIAVFCRDLRRDRGLGNGNSVSSQDMIPGIGTVLSQNDSRARRKIPRQEMNPDPANALKSVRNL
jgi:hypothetical protein